MTEFKFVSEQFSLSTAEEESALIVDIEWENDAPRPLPAQMGPGVYRVIAGELVRLIAGSPTN